MMSVNGRPEMMSGILTVKSKTYLTPHYISIVLEGADINNFKNAVIGDNNKLVIPVNGSRKIVFPEFGGKGIPGKSSDTVIRTYTLRNLDLPNQQMTVEFVAHGEEGPASAWAINAQPGDELGVLMKSKDKQLFQPSEWYLLAGDHTALPVISVILESLDKDARGEAIIEVHGPEDIQELRKPEHVNIVWIFNETPGINSDLPERFKRIDFSINQQSKFVFAAAEAKAIQQIQEILRNDKYLERNEWRAHSYWKQGQTEDNSSSERRELSKKA